MKRLSVIISIIFGLFSYHSATAQSTQNVITVHGEKNCITNTLDPSLKIKAAKIDLEPGNYKFIVFGGAFSRFKDDQNAANQGKLPWIWDVYIFVDGKAYELGSEEKYKTADDAFSGNKSRYVLIPELTKPTTVYFAVWDEYRGENYCQGNRGELKIGVIKK